MRATIIRPDNIVLVNGRAMNVDCSALDPNIRVVQWYDTEGEIEFDNEGATVFRSNGKLTDIAEFQFILDAWAAAAAIADTPEPLRPEPTLEEIYDNAIAGDQVL